MIRTIRVSDLKNSQTGSGSGSLHLERDLVTVSEIMLKKESYTGSIKDRGLNPED